MKNSQKKLVQRTRLQAYIEDVWIDVYRRCLQKRCLQKMSIQMSIKDGYRRDVYIGDYVRISGNKFYRKIEQTKCDLFPERVFNDEHLVPNLKGVISNLVECKT